MNRSGTFCFDPPPPKWRNKTNKQTKKEKKLA
jgi:hypothetical protein